jgi:hypothetical protein
VAAGAVGAGIVVVWGRGGKPCGEGEDTSEGARLRRQSSCSTWPTQGDKSCAQTSLYEMKKRAVQLTMLTGMPLIPMLTRKFVVGCLAQLCLQSGTGCSTEKDYRWTAQPDGQLSHLYTLVLLLAAA